MECGDLQNHSWAPLSWVGVGNGIGTGIDKPFIQADRPRLHEMHFLLVTIFSFSVEHQPNRQGLFQVEAWWWVRGKPNP